MLKNRTGGSVAGVIAVLLFAAAAVAQQVRPVHVTLTIKRNGQPVGNAQVALSLANRGKVSVGVSDSNGNVSGTLNLPVTGTGQADVVVEGDCPNGETRVTLMGSGGSDDKDCKKHKKAGALLLNDGAEATIDVGTNTMTVTNTGTYPSPTPTSSIAPAWPQLSIETGVSFGVSNYSNSDRFCREFEARTCKHSNNEFVTRVDGSVNLGKRTQGAINFGFSYDRPVNAKVESSSGTSTFTSSADLRFLSVHVEGQGLYSLGSSNRFHLVGAAGVQFWSLRGTFKESSSSGGSSSSSTSHQDESGIGPTFGGGIRYDLNRHWRLAFDYRWFQFRKDPAINQLQHEFTGGIHYIWGTWGG